MTSPLGHYVALNRGTKGRGKKSKIFSLIIKESLIPKKSTRKIFTSFYTL